MKKILILGGSQQIGRLFIEKFIEDSHLDITIFNRGKTNPFLFPNVKRIKGDRNTSDIDQIINTFWDFIIDCSCYNPYSLQYIVDKMQNKIGKYIFISTVSVYDSALNIEESKLIDESFPKKKYTKEQLDSKGFLHYGQKKSFAEDILINNNEIDFTILRPHFIYGKYDWQNLDYYWYYRASKMTQAIIPNGGRDLVSLTYVEDLVNCIYEMLNNNVSKSVFNITTHKAISHRKMIDLILKQTNSQLELIDIEANWLIAKKIQPITGIPLWSNGNHFQFSYEKIVDAFGISFTPLEITIKETHLKYLNSTKYLSESKIGINSQQEKDLISLYNKK